MGARILVADLERIPTWTKPLPIWDMKSLMDRRLGPSEVQSWGRTICLAYSWGLDGPVKIVSEWHEGGREGYLNAVLALLEETDVLVGHNSEAFDYKHLAGDLLMELGKTVPKIKHIDTLKIARQTANWENNQLITLTDRLGIPSKTDKYRIDVAMGAVGGDVKLQRRIERYCKGDVRASQGLAKALLPASGINLGLFEDDPTRPVCTSCLGENLQRRGFAVKTALKYPRYQCTDCGRWMTSKSAIKGTSVEMRPA